jgi:putative colanic acid biosynthesis glycosyltransferase
MVKAMPIFSVITVALNDRENFGTTLKSVLEQKRSLGDGIVEYIVIDGGSGDGTVDLIKENEGAIDRWISEPDEGLYDAMNKGIFFAHGKYLIFMNAGDTFAEMDTLKKVRDAVHENGYPDFIYGDGMDRAGDGRLFLKKARHHKWAWYGMFARHQTMFYKKEILDKHSLFYYGKPKYLIASDYVFTAKFLDKSETAVKVDFPVCIFLLGGLEHQMAMIGMKEQWRIRRDIMKLNIFKRFAISAVHIVMIGLRRYAFPIYSLLRYRNG